MKKENAFLNVTAFRIYIFIDKSFIYKYLLILAIVKSKSKPTESIFLHTAVSIAYIFISDTMVRFFIIYNEMCEFSFSFSPLVNYPTGNTIFALIEFKRLQLENKKLLYLSRLILPESEISIMCL